MRILESAPNLLSIPTRRSLVPPPADRSHPRWEESWRHLFSAYAPAMRRYVHALLRRAEGVAPSPEECADVVQDYLLTCVEKDWLVQQAREIRCFRAFLQVQLKRFTFKHIDRKRAAKRDGGRAALDLDPERASDDGADPATADFDASFVETAVAEALAALRRGNEVYAEIIADLLRTHGEGSRDLATRIGHAPRDLPILRHRARRRFGALLADELRATVRDQEAFAALIGRLDAHLP